MVAGGDAKAGHTHPTVLISPRLGRVGDGVVEGGGAKIGHR